MRSEMNVPAADQVVLVLVGAPAEVKDHASRWGETIRRLAAFQHGFCDTRPRDSAQMIVRGTVAVLPLQGIIDLNVEGPRGNS